MLTLLATIFVLLTPIYLVYKPPSLLIVYFQWRWPEVLWHVTTRTKIVALTIDDAPSEYTREILDVLEAHDAHATFFVIGAQVDRPERAEVLADLVRSGNELANHAMHDEAARSLSDEELALQISQVEQKIAKAYETAGPERPPKYFRPGSGFFSERMLRNVKSLGYRLVLGSIYPHDPQIPYWRVNARHVLSMLRPGGIVICHDRRRWTVPMLRRVLPEMGRRGYRVVTLTGLLEHQAT